MPGVVEDQLKGGATVSQHCPAGVQVLPQVSAEDGVQETVRQAAQPFGPHRQAGESLYCDILEVKKYCCGIRGNNLEFFFLQ